MYKVARKKNREDVVALRWPKACLSCGIEIPSHIHPRYAIVGMFHTVKQTQVLVKMPGFFYMCNQCSTTVESALSEEYEKPPAIEKLALRLQESPWNEFIKLEKEGAVRIPLGLFREKLQNANPEAVIRNRSCPMNELKQEISKLERVR